MAGVPLMVRKQEHEQAWVAAAAVEIQQLEEHREAVVGGAGDTAVDEDP